MNKAPNKNINPTKRTHGLRAGRAPFCQLCKRYTPIKGFRSLP